MAGTIGFGMTDPQLNNRRNKWYQKRYAVRIARRDICKKYIDGAAFGRHGPPPVVPVGWSYGMRVGLASDNVSSGYQGPERGTIMFGAISPATFSGKKIVALYSVGTEQVLYLNWPGQQIPGVTKVTMTAQGYGGAPVEMLWQSGSLRYLANVPAFNTFMIANRGKTIGINLSVIPAGWAYGMVPVLDASTFVGAQTLGPLLYGSLTPATYQGLGIYQFTVSSIGTTLFSLEYPSKVQAPGINTVTATLQGFGGSVVMPWLAGNFRYQAASQTALRTFLTAQAGNIIGVTFTGSA